MNGAGGRSFAGLAAAALAVLASACSIESASSAEGESQRTEDPSARVGLRSLDPPAAASAFAPSLTVAAGRLVASWLEKTEVGGARGHRLLVSAFDETGWSSPAVVAEGNDFFANWADFPAVIEAGDGSLLAHWLAKTGEETYAYSIFVARSTDGGATWTALGPLHDDATPTEHGFVSWIAEEDGARAFWLDGREMVAGGAMTLRTARVGAEIGAAEVLDERVCECCGTGAARAASGPLVAYRDRSDDEIRDISVVRFEGGWTRPADVAVDGWKIPGCPVNGPRVAARGERLAVAWFTAAGEEPRVKMAFSIDGGGGFEPPIVLDRAAPFGRTDVVLDDEGAAWVVWLAQNGERAAVRLQRVPIEGMPGEPMHIGETAGGRTSGFPRLARIGDRLFVAWVEIDGESPSRVRVAELAG